MGRILTAEDWDKLTLADNFIFCKVMTDAPDLCKEVIETLLDIEIDRIETAEKEKTLAIDYNAKGIRLDVYVKDGTGRSFNLEMQTTDKKDLAKRSRYYHSTIDIDSLNAGQSYNELKDSYVIFLCLDDIFGEGLPVYSFENKCNEKNDLSLGDGTYKVFFNARLYDKMDNAKREAFFKYLCKKENDNSDFINKLSNQVECAKTNADFRRQIMTLEQEIQIREKEIAEKVAAQVAEQVREETWKEAREETQIEFVKNLLANGLLSILDISKVSGLSVEKINELATR